MAPTVVPPPTVLPHGPEAPPAAARAWNQVPARFQAEAAARPSRPFLSPGTRPGRPGRARAEIADRESEAGDRRAAGVPRGSNDGESYPGRRAGNPPGRPGDRPNSGSGALPPGPRDAPPGGGASTWTVPELARPAPSLAGLSRVGLYGGSFDPVHLGHLHVAETAQRAAGLERVVFVPAAQSPHKPGRRAAAAADRLAMLELALGARGDWTIDDLELRRPPPSFTIDTLRAVRARWGLGSTARIFLVLGSDSLAKFPEWRAAREILELAEPIVVPREADVEALRARVRSELPPPFGERLARAIVDAPSLPAASSDIRSELRASSIAREQLPAAVREYIEARGIYLAPDAVSDVPSGALRPRAEKPADDPGAAPRGRARE